MVRGKYFERSVFILILNLHEYNAAEVLDRSGLELRMVCRQN